MRVVVCIPVYNEGKNISAVLENILSQKTLEFDLEILVVSSGSTDKTNEIISSYSQTNYSIKLIIEPERTGKANAINVLLSIIRESKFDICIFTDGDVYIAENSIKNLLERFIQNDQLSVVTGHPAPLIVKNDLWEKIAKENCAIWDEVRRIQERDFKTWTLSGYLFATRTKDLPNELPVDLAAEDSFLGISLLLDSKKMGYEPNALVYVKYPSNILDYYRQKSRTRSGWAQVLDFAPKQMKELRELQQQIAFRRIRAGKFMSLLCYTLDNLIWLLNKLFIPDAANRHIWKPVDSTK